MKQSAIIAIICIIILIGLAGVLIFDIGRNAPAGEPTLSTLATSTPMATTTPTPSVSPISTTTTPGVKQTSVKAHQVVISPLQIKGTALGTWFFEATFPIKIVDAQGTILGQTTGDAQADWATTNYVPFTAALTFSTSTTKTGTLVFTNDNPSGDPARDQSISVPITFAQ